MKKLRDIVLLYGVVPAILYALYIFKVNNDMLKHGYVAEGTFYWYAVTVILCFIISSVYLIRKYK